MPVRFRCAYCNQLMGISHRKVGSVVRCPKCAGQIVVPEPESGPEEAAPEQNPGRALEDPELELLLAGAAKDAAGLNKPRPKRKPHHKPLLEGDIDVEPLEPPPSVPPPSLQIPPPPQYSEPNVDASMSSPSMPIAIDGVILPRWVLAAMATIVLVLLGLAFLVGFLLGKHSAQ